MKKLIISTTLINLLALSAFAQTTEFIYQGSLKNAGTPATLAGMIEVHVDDDTTVDVVRDAVAELGLPLHRMSTRLTSLDDVFLEKAQH